MACDVTALNSVTDCPSADGGIEYSWYVSSEYVTAITVSSAKISNFTMSTSGKWKRLDYDKDGTSFFNETGNRTNRRLVYQQAALLKFAGKNAAAKAVTDIADSCCALIFIHILTAGERVVQGIEIDAAATGERCNRSQRDRARRNPGGQLGVHDVAHVGSRVRESG